MTLPTAMLRADWKEELDWSAIKRPLLYFDDDGVSQESSMMSIVRSDTNQEIGVVGRKYKVVQPSTILKSFEHAADNLGFSMDGVGMFNNGSIIWGRASGGVNINIDGDSTETYLYMITSFDGSAFTRGFVSTTRMSCCNAFHIGTANNSSLFSISHRSMYTGEAIRALENYNRTVELFKKRGTELLNKKMSLMESDDFIANLLYKVNTADLQGKQVDNARRFMRNVRSAPGQDGIIGTAWGVFNGITYTVDNDPLRRTCNHAKNVMMGSGNDLKQRAFNALIG